MQKIVIVGAGPAGLLLAHYLLQRQHYDIEIYDRRPDPRQIQPAKQRTFPITLQLRGLRALQGIPGLEAALAKNGIRSQGICLHRAKGKPRQLDRKNALLLIDRNRLVTVLLQQLQERDTENRVHLQFNCICNAVDYGRQTATFQSEPGQSFTTSFDRLVGADGASSQVRESLVQQGELQCENTLAPDVYKSIFIPRISPNSTTANVKELAKDRMHTWNIGSGQRLVLAPQPGNWLHGTLIFPPDNNPLESLRQAEEVRDFFHTHCPPLGTLITDEEATALLQRPVSQVPTVKCDSMQIAQRILLIGDAVHAVSPSIGQGCNASLQDVQVFDQLLDQYQDDWEQALPAFSAQRLPDVHALRELADHSFPRSKRMGIEFAFRLIIGKKLQRWLPQLSESLPLSWIVDSELPYTEVLRRCQSWVSRVKQNPA